MLAPSRQPTICRGASCAGVPGADEPARGLVPFPDDDRLHARSTRADPFQGVTRHAVHDGLDHLALRDPGLQVGRRALRDDDAVADDGDPVASSSASYV